MIKIKALHVILALAGVLLASFGLEAALTGGEGWSKYPEILGGYEILPLLAMAAVLLAVWLVRWVLGVSADFYERAAGDLKDEENSDA